MGHYEIVRKDSAPPADADWDSGYWKDVPTLSVSNFHSKSSDHRPTVRARLAHSDDALHVFFHVQDRYVRCVRTQYNDSVCRDSCVEFFIQPRGQQPYFNFEINCGGTMLLYYIEDSTRTDTGFAKRLSVDETVASQVRIVTSLPPVVDPEITEPLTWTMRCTVPAAVMEHYTGALAPLSGQHWRGNLYKCGDETSHPHWASWSPIGATLNFHQPEFFGDLTFGR